MPGGEGRQGAILSRGRLADIVVLAMVAVVILLLVVPLRQWVLDLLIGLNLALSLTVFAMALFIRRPLTFSVFPTILLMTTLYRLSLNIASTRLILTEADAGRIIGAFGGYVVGSDLLVGAVIFGILAMVLFLVITKGAERVAEVAARFTLDALPGMQLAVEADLRAGVISPGEITRRREELERATHYYGSLDGAMKFVRGDAVAALVIIAVNIAGGLAVGVIRHGMSFPEALETYGRLTVGDGLVTMIPALLVSTAAGFLLTRIGQGSTGEGLGLQISRQLASEPRSLVAAAAVMLVLAAVPALPAWPFLALGGAMAIGGVVALRVRRGTGSMEEHLHRSAANGETGTPGLDLTQALVNELARDNPVLVRETVPRLVSLPVLADILGCASIDGIGHEYLGSLLEALARVEGRNDAQDAWEKIRKRLPDLITAQLVKEGAPLAVAVVDSDVEDVLGASVTMTGQGPRLTLPGDIQEGLLASIDATIADMKDPVILVDSTIRGPLTRWLRPLRPVVKVIAHGELDPVAKIDIYGKIAM